jgi:hypothetical protein
VILDRIAAREFVEQDPPDDERLHADTVDAAGTAELRSS